MVVMMAAAAFALFMVVVVAAAAFALFMIMMVAAAAFALFMVVMMAAAAFAFFMVVMMAAAALAFFMVVMMAAAAFAFFMVVMMAAAAFSLFMVVVVAAAAFALFMIMVVAAAALALFMIVMMAAAAFTVVMVMAAAAVRFKANRIERLLGLRHFQADHFQHFCQIRQRQNGKSFGRFSNFNAAIDKRSNSLAHDGHITCHLQHLFDSRTHHPEAAFVINEEVVHMQRTHVFNSHCHFALHCLNSLRHRSALRRSKSDLMSLVENGLSGRRLRRQKLGKGSHGFKFPKGASSAAPEACRRSSSK